MSKFLAAWSNNKIQKEMFEIVVNASSSSTPLEMAGQVKHAALWDTAETDFLPN